MEGEDTWAAVELGDNIVAAFPWALVEKAPDSAVEVSVHNYARNLNRDYPNIGSTMAVRSYPLSP